MLVPRKLTDVWEPALQDRSTRIYIYVKKQLTDVKQSHQSIKYYKTREG